MAAIEQGDVKRAERLMLDHLNHVEQGIQQPASEPAELDFEQIFQLPSRRPAPAAQPARKKG